MSILDRLFRRKNYEATLSTADLQSSQSAENPEFDLPLDSDGRIDSDMVIEREIQRIDRERQELDQLRQKFADAKKTIEKLESDRLYLVPDEIRSKLLRSKLLYYGQKDFENINGIGIYLTDRHPTVYELVTPIRISDAAFRDSSFRGACFDNVFFKNVTFTNVDFREAYFETVAFDNCTFNYCSFDKAKDIDVQIHNCQTVNSNIDVLSLKQSEPMTEDEEAELNSYLREAMYPEEAFEDGGMEFGLG
jgi:hypothetical protein